MLPPIWPRFQATTRIGLLPNLPIKADHLLTDPHTAPDLAILRLMAHSDTTPTDQLEDRHINLTEADILDQGGTRKGLGMDIADRQATDPKLTIRA